MQRITSRCLLMVLTFFTPLSSWSANSQEIPAWRLLSPSDLVLSFDYGSEYDVVIKLFCNETGDITLSELNVDFELKELTKKLEANEPLLATLEANVNGVWTELVRPNLGLAYDEYYGEYGFFSRDYSGVKLENFRRITGLRLRSTFLNYDAPNENLSSIFGKWIDGCNSR